MGFVTGIVLPVGDNDWGHHMGDWGGGWWIPMAFLTILFWGLLIAGAIWLVRSQAGGRRRTGRESALDVLDHRLAAGEISPDEYRERRATLRDDGPEKSP